MDVRSVFRGVIQGTLRNTTQHGMLPQYPNWNSEINVTFNLLTPNVNYSGLTAPLTSKVAFYIVIQQI